MEREGFDPTAMAGNRTVETLPTLENFGLGQVEGGVGADILQTPELLHSLERIKSGEFTIDAEPGLGCIDERPDANGFGRNQARNAGGPTGVGHAHDLATPVGLNGHQTEMEVLVSDSRRLEENGRNASPHTDDRSDCGCGQINKAEAEYQLVRDNIDSLAQAVNALADAADGVGGQSPRIDTASADALRAKAEMRLGQEKFFTENRRELLDSVQEASGGRVETLVGAHLARAVVWVTQPGKTVDTARIAQELGSEDDGAFEVFVVNSWNFKNEAAAVNSTGYPDETELTEKGLAAINVATASVLCSNKMPILVV